MRQAQEMQKLRESLGSKDQEKEKYRKQVQEFDQNYKDVLEVEKSKSLNAGKKVARIEQDKERLTGQVNQLL